MRKKTYILLLFLSACAPLDNYHSPIAQKVAIEIENMQNAKTQMEAYQNLESMGNKAVPYIIGQLDNSNELPKKQISLTNNWPGAFEGLRHYNPKVVQEALAAILNQLTGESFGFIYNGSSLRERKENLLEWRKWCINNYPKLKHICLGKST